YIVDDSEDSAGYEVPNTQSLPYIAPILEPVMPQVVDVMAKIKAAWADMASDGHIE
ncbi:hypothetical protein A2U01_0091604, partial [Trifolium medium]|nr:hypothetical protein [Trifolium medium]